MLEHGDDLLGLCRGETRRAGSSNNNTFGVWASATGILELTLLPIGELTHQSMAFLPQVPLLEQALRLAEDMLVAGERAIQHEPDRVEGLHGQQHVLQHGQIGEQGGDLERAGQSQSCSSEWREMRHLLATEENPPRAGGQLATDEVKERRLPCAG